MGGSDVWILSYARSNRSCDGIEPPGLYLDKPPEHGSVCFRPSKVKLVNVVVGDVAHCLGRAVAGISVHYFPRSRYVGADAFQYSAIFPETRQTTDVDLTVLPDSSSSLNTQRSGIGIIEYSQPPGPMPACSPAVSERQSASSRT